MDFKTADLCDDHSSKLEICETEFKSFGKRVTFYGPVATVKVFEDNVLVVESLESIPEGSVLVVDGGASRRCALMGDRLAGIAETRKLAGVIINGCVRDSEDLAKLDVGIFALGTNPLKSKKEGKGEKQVTVTFGGIEWKPGIYVYADQDGVIVSEEKLF
ncbi:ribonuclease E activity regulator RraA [Mesobacillus maritimus]|uniref:ribonuclease E activity regulator RraA n=1 Tax=Mesobacillus maritimus TaxID=1643336 RepID=UPI0020415F82|nr:ribonuclease E activity regulator RraA [Mesobacillus maritimus]MCM3669772.1 ribonuclease E activity regulator RraA [Mesobacillus maritimus]